MRHAIANTFYRLAGRIDRLASRPDFTREGLEIGDKTDPWGPSSDNGDTSTVQLHTRDNSKIGGAFRPGKFTYASLQVGSNPSVTFFLTRRSTRRLLDTVRGIDELFCKYGEDK